LNHPYTLKQLVNQRKINYTPDGKALLYIWREGGAWEFKPIQPFSDHWNKVKFHYLPFPPGKGLITIDVRRGIPYPDQTFDAIYVFHTVEHISWAQNVNLLTEVKRMLKPGGVTRVSTPDFHGTILDYKKKLAQYKNEPSETSLLRYRWSLYKLIDQRVRTKMGGEMLKAIENKEYLQEDLESSYGDVFAYLFRPPINAPSLYKKDIIYYIFAVWRKLLKTIFYRSPKHFIERELIYFDDILLKRLLRDAGFNDVSRVQFDQSRIDNWALYNLDTSSYKQQELEPSLYIEGQKPK
jgi:SAM-dependent methyltransferase